MMGVYIKDMEMPECCYDCIAYYHESDGYEDYCQLGGDVSPFDVKGNRKNFNPLQERASDCQLISIPVPHGRLIDADSLIKEMDKQENAMYEHGHEFSFSFKSGGDVCTAWYNVEMIVEDAPTVIEAEEGE